MTNRGPGHRIKHTEYRSYPKSSTPSRFNDSFGHEVKQQKPGETGATYEQSILQVVENLGTSAPHHQVIKLLEWQYNKTYAQVKGDCIAQWTKLRHAESYKGRNAER